MGDSVMAESVVTPSSNSRGFIIPTINVNLIALLAAILLTMGGVKLTQFLPAKYYFSFSQLVSPNNATPFLIATPAYVSEQKLCEIIANDKRLTGLKCNVGETEEQPNIDEKEQAKQVEILNQDIKDQLHAGSSTTSLIGLAIRLCIPLLAGFISGRLFGLEAQLAAPLGAAAGALLLCWPVIVLWKLVVADPFKQQYGSFLLLYILYCLLFYYMARLGASLGSQTRGISAPRIDLSKLIETLLGAVATGVGAQLVQHVILKQ
jgi:hypothetical protein